MAWGNWVALGLVLVFALTMAGFAYSTTAIHRGNWALLGGFVGALVGLGAAGLLLLVSWLFGWGG